MAGNDMTLDTEAWIAELNGRYRIERSLTDLHADKLRRRARGDGTIVGIAEIGSSLRTFILERVQEPHSIGDLTRMSGGGSNACYSFTLVRGNISEKLVLRVKQPATVETYIPREFQM